MSDRIADLHPAGYGHVPLILQRDPRARPIHLAVYGVVSGDLFAKHDWSGFIRLKRIAERAGADRRTVRRALLDLRTWGYLLWEEIPGCEKGHRFSLVGTDRARDELDLQLNLARDREAEEPGVWTPSAGEFTPDTDVMGHVPLAHVPMTSVSPHPGHGCTDSTDSPQTSPDCSSQTARDEPARERAVDRVDASKPLRDGSSPLFELLLALIEDGRAEPLTSDSVYLLGKLSEANPRFADLKPAHIARLLSEVGPVTLEEALRRLASIDKEQLASIRSPASILDRQVAEITGEVDARAPDESTGGESRSHPPSEQPNLAELVSCGECAERVDSARPCTILECPLRPVPERSITC